MRKRRMARSSKDSAIDGLARRTDGRTLAVWAADCAERVLPLFEDVRPDDERPRIAIQAAREWARTGIFRMSAIRGASLAAHAAARDVEENDAARSAARAAGQAVATAHVKTHSIAAAIYAATSVRDAAAEDGEAALEKERGWQYSHLLQLFLAVHMSRCPHNSHCRSHKWVEGGLGPSGPTEDLDLSQILICR
jgi:hypothetical protein